MANIFWSNLFKAKDSELAVITRLWQDTPLFKDIPRAQIEFLSSKMHLRQFKQDEVVFMQGNQGAGVIMVLEGAVKVMANKTQLALLETGDFFGEIALAATEKRTADAYAVSNSRLVFFLKQDLEEWIDAQPPLGARFLMNLSAILALRLFEANKMIAQK